MTTKRHMSAAMTVKPSCPVVRGSHVVILGAAPVSTIR